MMLTRRKRKFLLWLTVFFFFLITIGVLFYSLGYRLGPQWQLQKTGGIFLHIGSTGVKVLVDGTLENTTSLLSQNALIKNLNAGVHEVIVQKDGFWQWRKVLPVASELVTARDVLLVPDKVNQISVATSSIGIFVPYYLSKNSVFQTVEGKPKQLFAGVKQFWELPKSNGLLLLGEDGNFYQGSKRISMSTSSTETLLGLDPSIARTLASLLTSKDHLIFDEGENRVIYWDLHTIGSYWIGKIEDMPEWQKTPSLLILTFPGEIRNVDTYPNHGDYLLVEIGSGIWAVEMDGVGGQNFLPIYQGSSPKIITKSSDSLTLFDKNQYITLELP